MEPFIPPRFNLALHWTVDATLPVLIKTGLNIDSIDVSDEDRQRLRELRNERLILHLNHPSTGEGAVAYHLGNQMGARFHYMASREVFDWLGGMMGVMLQGLGVFSVLPGTEDREAIRMARSLVTLPGGKLVVFPEGDYPTRLQNGLQRFEPDAVHLAFRALRDLRRAEDPGEVFLIPVAVRYVLSGTHQEIEHELSTSIRKLEERLGHRSGGSLPERLNELRLHLLRKGEEELGLQGGDRPLTDRMHSLSVAMLDRLAARHRVQDYPLTEDAPEKLRFLLSVIERRRVDFPDPRLPEMTGDELNVGQRDCNRSALLLVLASEAWDRETAEGLMERIRHLEEYASGSSRPRSSRSVVRLGQILRASEFLPAYERARKIGLAELTERLRTEIQSGLDQTRALCTRLG